jgi:glyoxylate reductase
VARCFVTRDLPGPALGRLRDAHEVEVWPERVPPPYEELIRHTREAEGLLSLLSDRVDAELIAAAPDLRVISNYAVGYDNIDLAAAAAREIPVGHTPGVLTEATADLTFALLLAAARRLPEGIDEVRAGESLTWEPAHNLGTDVYGATLGIMGFGRIGQAVARRAEGFAMKVLHTDSRSSAEDVGDLLERSDFVSIHTPLTSETRHLIDTDALARMKPTAILINTARGGVVDQDALRRALHDGVIGGAALDVTEPEPLPPDDPLLTAPNLIVVPLIGSATKATRERMADLAVENLLEALAGRPMPHEVPVAGQAASGSPAPPARAPDAG